MGTPTDGIFESILDYEQVAEENQDETPCQLRQVKTQ